MRELFPCFCHKGTASFRGINTPFLYSAQKFLQEVSRLGAETIVAARTIVFVSAGTMFQSQVQGKHRDIPTVYAQVLQPADEVRHGVAVQMTSLRTLLHRQARLEARCLHNLCPQLLDVLVPQVRGEILDGAHILQRLALVRVPVSHLRAVDIYPALTRQLFQESCIELRRQKPSKTCVHLSKFCEKAEVMHLSLARTLTQLGVNDYTYKDSPCTARNGHFCPICGAKVKSF